MQAVNLITPQFPPPAVPTHTAETEMDESQYCSPWDLKLQEEMFKIMSQRGDEFNGSIKSNKSTKDIVNSTIKKSSLNEAICDIEQNEYSPPWDHKQSILLQSLTNASNKSISNQLSAPLATSSAISTLNSLANINQNQAISSLYNQFNRGRFSTRSNTSSSSSSHSSTSSLSTNSPPSIPPPPLPPSIPPLLQPITALNSSSCLNNSFNRSAQQNQPHQSPHNTLSHIPPQFQPITVLHLVNSSSCLNNNNFNCSLQQSQSNQTSYNTFSQLKSLERQNWFHGRITRKHAEIILNNRPIGSYLVRQSESGNSNDFSLSLV